MTDCGSPESRSAELKVMTNLKVDLSGKEKYISFTHGKLAISTRSRFWRLSVPVLGALIGL